VNIDRDVVAEQVDVVVAGVRCTIDVGPDELVEGIGLVLPGPVGPQVDPSNAELRLAVESVEPTGTRDARGVQTARPQRYVLRDAGRQVTEPCGAAEVLQALEHHLRIWVSVLSPDCLLVHAGVVAVAGRAVVLAGPSGSGKSTLVLALVEAGADYLSDDVAVIDASGQVWPWPRAPRRRASGGIEHPPVPPAPIGQASVAAVVFTRFDSVWDVRPIGPAQTASLLLRNTPCARSRSSFALQRCAELARLAPGFQGGRGEAVDAVAPLMKLLGSR
jgi:hypothetical protein